ncbi:MAG TPA: dihydroneopterin aldolase [Candidatus Avirikenella pullistercoris]|nr:dihydroneopterin aldolase [Candidatus Avirikenella pullistercoris]
MKKGVIEIENMEFYAYHGCYKEEKVVGNRFIVYMKLETDVEKASVSDDVKDTVSYLEVYQVVKEQMEIGSNILEHVARRILSAVVDKFPQIDYALVKISKMNPPLGGQIERVSVTMDCVNN